MAEWWLSPPPPPPPPLPYEPYFFDPYNLEKPAAAEAVLPPQAQHSVPPSQSPAAMPPPPMLYMPPPKADNPREMRNKAEKQRRDKLNQSIATLASLVPPVVFSSRKIDKTGVLRYTAHYLRAHRYVFNPEPEKSQQFAQSSTQAILSLLNGFLLSTTYKGLIVVVSQNINEYLGHTEVELLGKSIFSIVHEDDRQLLRDQLIPKSQELGNHGELLVPNEQKGREAIAEALANEKRRFIVRFSKLGQRSEPNKYVTCHVEGSFRMSDSVLQGHTRCCHLVRRARARGENPCSSGNDVVFIGVVRPCTETFINESALESYRMEYRTRHSIDGEIIQCEHRIALVTGYMMNEVSGINAMNFIHRDEVRWVIIALKEMYNQCQLFGESCYRLMTKNGQFIYMRTRGRLDVDTSSRAVTSFVCTNTVVDEREGKELIKMMKERFTLLANYGGVPAIEEYIETNDSQAVEDPRQLEKVILNMVTTLPSADETNNPRESPSRGDSPHRLALIPPEKERIVNAIGKIYTVLKTIPKPSAVDDEEPKPIIKKKITVPTICVIPPQDDNEKDSMMPPCSENYNLPPFNELFQAQSGSETENSSNYTVHSPMMPSDFGSVMANSYGGKTPGLTEVDSTPAMQFNIQPPAMNGNEGIIVDQVRGLNNPVGVKRPRCDDQETTSKKKAVFESNAAIEETDIPDAKVILDQFFGEDALIGGLPADIAAVDENVNLDFLDFLSLTDLETFLDTKNKETGEE